MEFWVFGPPSHRGPCIAPCSRSQSNLGSSLGLHSLSLLKNRTRSLNTSWSDVLLVAHAPYLVTADKATLVLWNRKTLEPFSTMKETHIKKMIILVENQEVSDSPVPGKSFLVGPSSICFRVKILGPQLLHYHHLLSLAIPFPNLFILFLLWEFKDEHIFQSC